RFAAEDKAFVDLDIVSPQRFEISHSALFVYAPVLCTSEMCNAFASLLDEVVGGHEARRKVVDHDLVAIQIVADPVDEHHGNVIIEKRGEVIVLSRFHGQRNNQSAYAAVIKCARIGNLLFETVV